LDEIIETPGSPIPGLAGIDSPPGADADAEQDPLYDQAVQVVIETKKASISGVQRRLKIGYNRAARMVESMESAGLVGPLQSNGSREILIPNAGKE
jgi:S-DNA-T family DNA segregation ATPase FtsK/SpoIIIE